MSRIRIKDIARLANVSTGTVDRVIHNRSGVSEITRQRIQDIIEKYDYQPDILAGALASSRTTRILVCMPAVVHEHAFWRLPELGIARALDELRHFDIQVEYLRFDQNNNKDFQRKTSGVDPKNYDALLFAPVFGEESCRFIKKWDEENVPFMLFNGRIGESLTEPFIGQDAFESGYLGGKLMNYGLPAGRDLLVVNLSLRKDNYQHIIKREKGFRAYFEEHTERINNLVSIDIHGGAYENVAQELSARMSQLNVAGIFVTNSRVHLVARYLAEIGNMNTRLIGYDLLPESIEYLKREYIDFLISQSPEEQSYLGIRQLFNVVVMKSPVQSEILLPIDVLTKENVDFYLKFNKYDEQS